MLVAFDLLSKTCGRCWHIFRFFFCKGLLLSGKNDFFPFYLIGNVAQLAQGTHHIGY